MARIRFDFGTLTLDAELLDTPTARAVAAATRQAGLRSVAGGGDTVAALRHAGVMDDFSYVSSAGGAFLEWIEGKILPGVEVLSDIGSAIGVR